MENVKVMNNEALFEEKSVGNGRPLYKIHCYLPLASSVGVLLFLLLGQVPLFTVIGGLMVGLGFLAALTVAPLRMIKFYFKSIYRGFKICRGFVPFYGIGDLVAALLGSVFGFVFALAVMIAAPAVFTVKKYHESV